MNPESDQNQAGQSEPGQDPQPQAGVSLARVLLTAVTSIAILLASLAGYKVLESRRKPPPQKPPEPISIRAQIMEVELGPRTVSVTARGNAVPKREVHVTPEVSGRLVSVHPQFRDGGVVPRGALLYEIESVDYAQNQDMAEANLEAALSDYRNVTHSLAATEDMLEFARENRDIAKKETEKQKSLHLAGVVAESVLNQQQSALNSAEIEYKRLADTLDQLKETREKSGSAVDAAKTQVEQARTVTGRTRYHAPFAARVSGGKLDPGQVVAAGQVLGKLQDVSVFEVQVKMSMSDWRSLSEHGGAPSPEEFQRMGVDVRGANDEGEMFSWTGRVVRAGAELDPLTRLVTIVVEVPRSAGRRLSATTGAHEDVYMMPMMFCQVEFTGPTLPRVARIPRRALHADKSGGDFVYVVEKGKLAVRPVTVWRHAGDEILITKGLLRGDKVITSVVEEAVPGIPVTVVSRDKKL